MRAEQVFHIKTVTCFIHLNGDRATVRVNTPAPPQAGAEAPSGDAAGYDGFPAWPGPSTVEIELESDSLDDEAGGGSAEREEAWR